MVSSAGVRQSQESESNPALEYLVVSQAAHISFPFFARVRARNSKKTSARATTRGLWRRACLDVMLIIKLSYARKRIVFGIFYIPLVAKKLYFIMSNPRIRTDSLTRCTKEHREQPSHTRV